jgi:hypothetical protein
MDENGQYITYKNGIKIWITHKNLKIML